MTETVTITQVEAWQKFDHWFFKECNEGTRRHLFALFGLPVEEIRNHGIERHCLRFIRKALSSPISLTDIREEVGEAQVIVRAAKCGHHFTADCDSCQSALEWTNRQLDELRALSNPLPRGSGASDELVERLFRHIEHGDEKHRAWLNDELHKFFAALNEPSDTKALVGIIDEIRSTLSADYLDRIFGPDMKQRIDAALARKGNP